MLGIGTAVISVIALVVILLRDWILGMFQPDFLLGSTALTLLLLTLPLVYLTTMLANYAIATNRLRLLVGVAILLVVTNIGLNLLLIPHYGIDGAAAATL
jgi:O-antigen/teichoic acid export membrane protein